MAWAWLCLLQGLYFLATGVWPLVHLRSFLKVTGPKIDLWLVRTVGALIAVIGVVMIVLAARLFGGEGDDALLAWLLGVGAAVALAAVDLRYAFTGVISKIYLLDAAAELLLTAAWVRLALVG